MTLYVRSIGLVSPQPTLDPADWQAARRPFDAAALPALEPDYARFVDAKQIRRMGRLVKMGVAAALTALREAGLSAPSAIVTGTAYGCLEDTAVFLRRMVENHETLLTPTAFIQSTHNTVGAQVSLLLGCHAYNNTIVHRGLSFEHALTDARLFLAEHSGATVLAGAADEITADSKAILTRFGLFRRRPEGEGAAFLLLSQNPEGAIATIEPHRTLYKPAAADLAAAFDAFTRQGKPDLLLSGAIENEGMPPGVPGIDYKAYCGDYPTASSFAVALAARIVANGSLPAWIGEPRPAGPIRSVLVHNDSLGLHHSFFRVTAC